MRTPTTTNRALGLPILIGLVMAASALKLGLNRLSALQRYARIQADHDQTLAEP